MLYSRGTFSNICSKFVGDVKTSNLTMRRNRLKRVKLLWMKLRLLKILYILVRAHNASPNPRTKCPNVSRARRSWFLWNCFFLFCAFPMTSFAPVFFDRRSACRRFAPWRGFDVNYTPRLGHPVGCHGLRSCCRKQNQRLVLSGNLQGSAFHMTGAERPVIMYNNIRVTCTTGSLEYSVYGITTLPVVLFQT